MYKYTRNHFAYINAAILGHSGICDQSLSSLSFFTPQADCLKNISHLYMH